METLVTVGVRLAVVLLVTGCGATARQEDRSAVGGSSGGGTAGSEGGAGAMGGARPGAGASASAGTDTAAAGGDVAGGGAGGARGSGEVVALGRSSWNVSLSLSRGTGETDVAPCGSTGFTLHLEPNGAGLALVSGRDGLVISGGLDLVSATGEPPVYGATRAARLPSLGVCGLTGFGVTKLSLVGRDDNSDGIADRVEGSGLAEGYSLMSGSDVGSIVNLTLALTGVPDTTPPALAVPSVILPLEAIWLTASEPLAVATTVKLIDAANESNQVLLTASTVDNVAAAKFYSTAVLPCGSKWNVAAAGSDLADLPVVPRPEPILVVDPGLFAQDGFESSLNASTSGGAAVVTGVGTLVALAGAKSLFVPPPSRVTLHLAGSTNVTTIRFKARTLSTAIAAANGTPPIIAGIVGGTRRVTTPGLPAGEVVATGNTDWPYAGPTQDYALTVTELGKDAVVSITMPATTCAGSCPPAQAFLIDDLVAE